MANPGHLEKMGRELKCPICLSLLKSSVSLGCNHVFCNLCIKETMKSVSDCPVCKAPFRRREVRPAPHMDNLVTVFKSMEAAAGVNILTTQIAPSTKNSEDKLPLGNVENSTITESVKAQQGKLKRKAPNNMSRRKDGKANIRTSEQCSSMPSFPAKKRVHVTPYPISETPLRPEKVCKSGNTGIELETNKVVNENKKVAADSPESLFAPFFWLREENDDDDETLEKLSAQAISDSSQPYNAPCFSDMKDSDEDKSPIKMTSTSKSNVAEAFDSEMFEWTQRACSPELCLTPLNKKSAGSNEIEALQEKFCQELPEIGMTLISKSTKTKKTVKADGNAKRIISVKKGTFKRRQRPRRRSQTKNPETSINTSSGSSLYEVSTEGLNSGEMIKYSSHENEDIPNRGNRSDVNNDDIITQVSKGICTVKEKVQNHEKENIGAVLPLLKHSETNSGIADMQNNTNKRGKKLTFQPKRKHMTKSLNDVEHNVLKEVPGNDAGTPEQGYQEVIADPNHTNYSQGCENGRDKCNQELPEKKVGESIGSGRRNQTSDTVLDNDVNKVKVASVGTAGYKPIQTSMNLADSNSLATRRLLKTKEFVLKNGENILRKCGDLKSKIRCAFCLSYHDTKDSGEMMHYFKGKPVAADYNGGANVIPSHKHCTEWAPDVYFEDDLAVNLASELSRSRRIKCSCCGIKGAALGCYEKSCRKSFHFTCAKLVSGCQWDDDNFVMLCPLHSSSKLPKETSMTRRQRRKSSIPKEELLKTSHDMSRMWTWPLGSPCKWVLCCSALTATEKEIISEFARLTGVSISKTWSPAVTHLIASTDANGACKRTLKYLMAILNGKWILSIEWIKACTKTMEPVNEEKFEITIDVHGTNGGPRLGRMRVINKEPKIFGNLMFYLSGDFMPAYKSYLQDLVISAGGAILQRKPITRDQEKLMDKSCVSVTIVIYSLELPEKHKGRSDVVFEGRRVGAQALADACGGKVATNSWIIDSIAASKLQPLTC